MLPDHQPSLLIFGYGSLIWNPGFEFYDSRKAYAIGFARRMYQGNTFHRGNLKQVNQEKIIALRESERKARKGGGGFPHSKYLVLRSTDHLFFAIRFIQIEPIDFLPL